MPTEVWLAVEHSYGSTTPHYVFATEQAARAYATLRRNVAVERVRFFPEGEAPVLREAWMVTAEAGGRGKPPELEHHAWAEFEQVPAWAKQPCELIEINPSDGAVWVAYGGYDRDLVLARCVEKYEEIRRALGLTDDDEDEPDGSRSR